MTRISAMIALSLATGATALQGQVPAPPTPPAVPMVAEKPPEWPKDISGKDLKGWLTELKESTDGSVREYAIKVIPQFGPPARRESIKPLLAALRQENDPGVKVHLLMVIGTIGAETPEEAREITEGLRLVIANAGLGSPYRLHATRAMINYGAFGASAIPELKSIAADPSWEIRRAVATALGHVGRVEEKPSDPSKLPAPNAVERRGPNATALATLNDRLSKEKTVAVRFEIVQSMILLGPPGYRTSADYPLAIKPYLTSVSEQLKVEKDKAIVIWLYVLVMLYDGTQLNDGTIAKIADNIVGTDYNAKVAAIRALGMLGDRSKPALPKLIEIMKVDDNALIAEAIQCLASMQAIAIPALPELEKIKKDSKEEVLKTMAGNAIDIISGRKNVAVPPKK